jgi:hypothetical protein
MGTPNSQVLNAYVVSSSEAATIFPGDVIVMTSIATVKAPSTGTGAAALANIIGFAASVVTAGAGSTNVATGVKALVYDSPDLIFVMSNTSSGAIAQGSLGLFHNYNISTTGCVGSTGPNGSVQRSVMALSGVTGSSAGNVRVIALHPIEGGYFTSNATGTAQKFLCMWSAGSLFANSTALLTT